MSLTLGLTGMDPDTEAALKAAFEEANARLGGHWRLAPEAEADHVVVDMDSMYGPMSWLRLHAAGKRIIGLTSATRTQADFRLGRPFDGHQVATLLQEIAQGEAAAPAAAAAMPDADSAQGTTTTLSAPGTDDGAAPGAGQAAAAQASGTVVAGHDDHASNLPGPAASGMTPAPAPQHQLPEETVAPEQAAVPPPEPEPVPAVPEPPPRDPVFVDWLAPGALTQRVRYRRPGGPALLIDPVAQAWHGPALLKPIAEGIGGTVRSEDFEPVDDADWAAESAAAGPAQPLSRLRWLGGLLAGQGALLPGHDPDGRYALNKWPQTEREYPKHFRIATAMMKGPATVAGIAEASGIPAGDVADFINANLATGYAEFVPEPPPEPLEPPRPGGLLGRLRNR